MDFKTLWKLENNQNEMRPIYSTVSAKASLLFQAGWVFSNDAKREIMHIFSWSSDFGMASFESRTLFQCDQTNTHWIQL